MCTISWWITGLPMQNTSRHQTKTEAELQAAVQLVAHKQEELANIKERKEKLLQEESEYVNALQENDQQAKEKQKIESFIQMAQQKMGAVLPGTDQAVFMELMRATYSEYTMEPASTSTTAPTPVPMEQEHMDAPTPAEALNSGGIKRRAVEVNEEPKPVQMHATNAKPSNMEPVSGETPAL